jgi:hypothetical protein
MQEIERIRRQKLEREAQVMIDNNKVEAYN